MKKETVIKVLKRSIENVPFVLATSILGVGEVFGLLKDSYDEIELDKRLKELDKKIEELDEEIEEIDDLEEKFDEFERFIFQFENAKKTFVTKEEEYEIQNIDCVEIFFADYIELNDADFIDNLMNVLEEINEECTVHGTYGCVYENYILSESGLQIIFEETFEREYVEEYIQKIVEGIRDPFKFTSPISKVRYYSNN